MIPERMPNKESKRFTPEELTRHVQQHETLPITSREELEQMNTIMTQEQIITYHTAVISLADQKKSIELLDQWIPKPKILYHASATGNISEFEPRAIKKRTPEDPAQVFAARSKAVAAMMLAPGGDYWGSAGSYDNGITSTYIFYDSEMFRRADKGGYIYPLPPDTFTCNPHIGLGIDEWTSAKPVKPTQKPDRYRSSVQAMLDHGVRVYAVGLDTFKKVRDPNHDTASLLQELQPISKYIPLEGPSPLDIPEQFRDELFELAHTSGRTEQATTIHWSLLYPYLHMAVAATSNADEIKEGIVNALRDKWGKHLTTSDHLEKFDQAVKAIRQTSSTTHDHIITESCRAMIRAMYLSIPER